MKNIALGVMMIVIGGNIFYNSFVQEALKPIVYAQEPEPIQEVLIEAKIDWTRDRIKEEVKLQSEKYNVPYDEMWDTILCESGASTTIQSYHIRKDGTREQSFGLAQIHLPDHPTVSREEAIDPEFAINFMAKNWHKVRWYCRD